MPASCWPQPGYSARPMHSNVDDTTNVWDHRHIGSSRSAMVPVNELGKQSLVVSEQCLERAAPNGLPSQLNSVHDPYIAGTL